MDKDQIYQGNAAGENEVTPFSAPVQNSPVEPMTLVRILLRGLGTILLITIIGVLAGLIYVQKAKRVYKAEAELEMSIRRPKVINNEAVYEDSSWVGEEDVIFNTRFKKFRSPAMERLATNEYFKRYPEDEASGHGAGIGKYMLATLVRDVEWTRDPNANVVTVSCYSSNPEFAAKLVNVLTFCAGQLMMQENQARSEEAVKWLVGKIDQQRNDLEEVERQQAEIREELQLDSLEQRKEAVGHALISVTAERELVISELENRKTVHRFITSLKKTEPNLEMLPSGFPKEEQLNEMMRSWRAANEELLLVAGHYTKIHPEYIKAEKKEKRAKDRLQQFVELSATSVQNKINLLSKQLQQLDDRIETIETEALDLEQLLVSGSRRLQRIDRERDAADFSYQSTLRRMEEARLSADESMAFTNVIRNADVPRIPERPQKVQVMIVSIFLGGLSGCLFVLTFSFLTDKIESVTDLRRMGLNVLGTVPAIRDVRSQSDLATIGLHDKFSRMVEVFAGVNALISSDKYAERTRVLLMNSSMPGEGKTISACNLAICSAMNGSKTLLIDCDLRRPQLVDIFDINKNHPSLLEWLSDDVDGITHDKLVSREVIENLDVITSRPVKNINPAELLGRRQLAELFEWARGEYDRVIVDSPPLGPVGDAQVLVNYVDSVIMLSRVGKTRRRALRFALARYDEVDAFVLGCIANDVSLSLVGMFGGAEGYGYGYGKYASE